MVELPHLAATKSAFLGWTGAAPLVVWGDPGVGGDAGHLQDSIVTWGDPDSGAVGEVATIGPARQIFSNWSAFGAILEDGRVICWGNPVFGGSCRPESSRCVLFLKEKE